MPYGLMALWLIVIVQLALFISHPFYASPSLPTNPATSIITIAIQMSTTGFTQEPLEYNCLDSFQFPICYFVIFAQVCTFVLGVFISYDLIIKVKYKGRVSRKAVIIGFLLLECISFFVLSVDHTLLFFYFVMIYMQDLGLCAIMYYYSRKVLTSVSLEQFLPWTYVAPILIGVTTTGFFVTYLVNYITVEDPIQCKQSRYQGLGIIALSLSFILLCMGLFLTRVVKGKLENDLFKSVKRQKELMLKKFWAFITVVCLSIVVNVIENQTIGDNHNCPFLPKSPLGDCFLKLICKIFGFYLPSIVILLNFKTEIYKPRFQSRNSSQVIKIEGLYYSHDESIYT